MRTLALTTLAVLTATGIAGCKTEPSPSDCQSSIQRTANGFRFGGVELPFFHTTQPIKIASFEYTATAINNASDLVQLADQHRMTVCTNMRFMSQAARDDAGRESIQDDAFTTRLAFALSTGHPDVATNLINAEIDRWNRLSGTSAVIASNPTLAEKAASAAQLPKLPPPPGQSQPSGATVTPLDKATMTATLANDVTAGNCTLHAGSYIRLSGATGYFKLVASTNKSDSGDIWWADWDARDAQGNAILSAQRARTDGRIKPDDGTRTTTGTTPLTGASRLNDIYDVVWRGSC